MRFLNIKLTGYIGIYQGMRLNQIEIDFTKARHRLIIIKGANGSGKSTLQDAINPLPDPNHFFIPGVSAKKEILLQDRDIAYKIVYHHPIKNGSGDRDTTKGYIYKNGVLLNPNGNISDAKNIVYEELDLDPNFIALSALSTEDRGLVDKKPADRKRFMNSFVPSIDVYNNIYKKLSKKSSILKASINTITAKIESTPSEESLNETLKSLNSRIDEIKNIRDDLVSKNAVLKATVQQLDPNGEIQNEYNNLVKSLTEYEKELTLLKNQIDFSLKSLELTESDNIADYKTEVYSRKIVLETSISETQRNIETILVNRENESKELQKKIARLNSITNDISYSDLLTQVRASKRKLDECEKIFNKMGLKDATILTKDEYITGLEKMREIKLALDVFRDTFSYGIISEVLDDYIYGNKDINTQINNIQKDIKDMEEMKIRFNSELIKVQAELDLIESLKIRPDNCKIDSCPFIKEAVIVKEKDPESNLKEILMQIRQIEDSLEYSNKELNKLTDINSCIFNIKNILRTIDGYKFIFNKLPCGETFTNKDIFYTKIMNSDLFEEIMEVYKYIDYSNLIDEYNITKNTLSKLEEQQRLFASKHSIIEEIQNDIENLETKTKNLTKELEDKHKSIKDMKLELSEIDDKLVKLTTLVNFMDKYNTLYEKNKSDSDRYNEIWKSMNDINKSIEGINHNDELIKSYTTSLSGLEKDRSSIEHTIRNLQEYKVELSAYTDKYNKIEIVKRYSSPTKGIQNIFMEIYMNKIIDLSNQMLAYLFGGEYALQPFIITADEFRIPCQGNGLLNDDISSMSTAQKSMISMIVSFALLYQSSTKYNILHLDEIDGGLDTNNRLQFTYLLNQLMDLLNSEQCFMVSHNNEINTDEADIILLKNPGEQITGNIIWSLE